MDPGGRLRLDAVARFLQDAAIDDVEETGWGAPEHLWYVRRVGVDVVSPFLEDRSVELLTWCNGLASVAAGRRWSLRGDAGGRIEVGSVWIHLGADGRPARIENFSPYAEAAGGRRVSARPELPGPVDGRRIAWPVRATDVDLHGHVNNTVHWQAVEEVLRDGGPDPRRPFRTRLEFREPLDLGDELELVVAGDGERVDVGFLVAGQLRAVAALEPLAT